MKKPLKERALDATDAYLERSGIHVFDVNKETAHGTIPLVGLDDETLVYVDVHVDEKPSYPITQEIADLHWQRMKDLMAELRVEQPVRFDIVSILVIAEDRALLRHHKAAYNVGREEL